MLFIESNFLGFVNHKILRQHIFRITTFDGACKSAIIRRIMFEGNCHKISSFNRRLFLLSKTILRLPDSYKSIFLSCQVACKVYFMEKNYNLQQNVNYTVPLIVHQAKAFKSVQFLMFLCSFMHATNKMSFYVSLFLEWLFW